MNGEKNVMSCCDIKLQTKILEEVKQLLLSNESGYNYMQNYGLCHYLRITYNKYNITGGGVEGFSIENARILAHKYGFLKPDGLIYWWTKSYTWNSSRASFIDALICELKLKSVNQSGKLQLLNSTPLKFKEHNLDVFYNPEYNGFQVIHKYHGDTVTIGACCNFYDDAYTCICRYTVKKSYLDKLIKLDKQNLYLYPFIENYKFSETHYAVSVLRNRPEKSYLFFKDKAIITSSYR